MSVEKIGPLLVWPESDGIWRYLPLAPVPQRNEAGRPMVTVMEAGGMVMLTIGARLEATEADVVAARKMIAAKTGQAVVDLRPASVAVTGASLRLVAADKTETELAAARPSNLPPYTAAFSAMLQGDQAKAVKEALPAGRVIVRYTLDLPRRRNVTAELAGPWDGTGSVKDALARGDLRLRTMADDGASATLIKRAVDKVMAEADRPPQAAGGTCSTRSATYVEVTETETETEDLKLDAVLADWIN
jgi:hypothetical protein